MNIRQLTDTYSVTPQITADDVKALRDAGFSTVICNRPDAEVPADLQAEAIGAAVRAEGMTYEVLPVTHQTMTDEVIARQMAIIEASDGPVLAYCASGTRCSVIWSLGQAGKLDTDEILATTAKAGYDLAHLRPMIAAMAER